MVRKVGLAGLDRGQMVRDAVLDAAERLLRVGHADFSMRDLAAEAGVSFATPFNRFGNKAAIMHALSVRRIDAMALRISEGSHSPDAWSRVMDAVDIAVAVMLAEPAVNRTVMGWMGTAAAMPGDAYARSTALWALALGIGGEGADGARDLALAGLARQLALGFRGALSFWTSGELSDAELGPTALEVAGTLMLGIVEKGDDHGGAGLA